MQKPDIKVDESIPTAKGVNFVLYPIKDLHTEEDVETTKSEIHRLRDVITIRTTWLHDPKAVQDWKQGWSAQGGKANRAIMENRTYCNTCKKDLAGLGILVVIDHEEHELIELANGQDK